MKVTRYWTDGAVIKSAEGEINKYNDFVFIGAFSKRTIHDGYHCATKQEAFEVFCFEAYKNIENIKNKIESVRAQL